MHDWYLWLTPIAVGAIVSLLCHVGCNQIFGLDEVRLVDFTRYVEEVLSDAPVMYLRLQESSPATTIPGGVAVDEMGSNNGTYERIGTVLADDPSTLSPTSGQPLLDLLLERQLALAYQGRLGVRHRVQVGQRGRVLTDRRL